MTREEAADRWRALHVLQGHRLVQAFDLYDLWDEASGGASDLSGYRMICARNRHGDWIGLQRDAERICGDLGIDPEPRTPGHVCEIGKSHKDGKWYGWSHRGIAGFGIGDAFPAQMSTRAIRLGARIIATDEEAREAAEWFAEDIS